MAHPADGGGGVEGSRTQLKPKPDGRRRVRALSRLAGRKVEAVLLSTKISKTTPCKVTRDRWHGCFTRENVLTRRANHWHCFSIPQLGVHDRVNGQAPSRAIHILMIVVRDLGSVLVYAHDRGIDHLHRRVMTGSQRIHDLVPDAGLPPPNEAMIASGTGTTGFRQIAPGARERRTQKMPLSTRRSFARRTPRGLLGSISLMAAHS